MAVRITDLAPRIQPTARRLAKQAGGAFSMIDLISAGFYLLEQKDVSEIFSVITQIREADAAKPRQKRGRPRTKG